MMLRKDIVCSLFEWMFLFTFDTLSLYKYYVTDLFDQRIIVFEVQQLYLVSFQC